MGRLGGGERAGGVWRVPEDQRITSGPDAVGTRPQWTRGREG